MVGFLYFLFFFSQVIPLRASNLLQTELKKIVFVGNKDYMQREVETFSFLEKQLELGTRFYSMQIGSEMLFQCVLLARCRDEYLCFVF